VKFHVLLLASRFGTHLAGDLHVDIEEVFIVLVECVVKNDQAFVNLEGVIALGASVILGHLNAYCVRIPANLLSFSSH
jgi:hypothetical protein